jgi:hypothetical protein
MINLQENVVAQGEEVIKEPTRLERQSKMNVKEM